MQLPTKINVDDSHREKRYRLPGLHGTNGATASQNDDDCHDPDAVSWPLSRGCRISSESIMARPHPHILSICTQHNEPRTPRTGSPMTVNGYPPQCPISQLVESRTASVENQPGLVALAWQIC